MSFDKVNFYRITLCKDYSGTLLLEDKMNIMDVGTEAETSPFSTPLPPNESFNREQTLFLTDLMHQQLEVDGSDLTRILKELNS